MVTRDPASALDALPDGVVSLEKERVISLLKEVCTKLEGVSHAGLTAAQWHDLQTLSDLLEIFRGLLFNV